MLKPGDKAPEFTLTDQRGSTVSLEQLRGRSVVLFFYPKADTPGCTTQACGLRDAAADLDGAQIVGISPDPPDKQARFDEKYGLGYPLLADEEHKVAEAYGVWGEKSMYGRTYMGIIRSAFLIDAEGRVAEAWYKISPKATAERLLKAVAG